ncbi:MAG: hypothetical protein RIT27_2394 [Pseudomonadota bacterium]|jgi:pyridoxal phosphate enzyme (YggS family)
MEKSILNARLKPEKALECLILHGLPTISTNNMIVKHPVQPVLETIHQTAIQHHRNPAEITLVAVSKTKPIEDILKAYQAGVRHFGENRAAELEEKAQTLAHLTDIKWHFIGHLQSRQIKPITTYAHYFHAVDRLKIAEKLAEQLDHILPIFIEVNISGEESKAGFKVEDWENNIEQRQHFIDAVTTISKLPHLQITGLMTMAPWNVKENAIREVFKRLKQLSLYLNEELPDLNAFELSMGMSDDFEIAIEEGATFVRIGSAIFGER